MIKNILQENFALKILSLCLAILLELYLYSPDNSVSTVFSVPVEIKNISPLMILVEPQSASEGLYARLSIRGPSPLVDQVKAANNRFVVDLGGSTSSQQLVTLDVNQLRLPAGVKARVDPEQIQLRFERIMRKELPVTVEQLGIPKKGFVVRSVEMTPKSVVADGPASELESVNAIVADAINVADLSESKTFEVLLKPLGKLINLKVNFISVRVNVSPIDVDKQFDNLPVTVLAPAGYAASAEPSKIGLTVTGSSDVMDRLTRDQIQVTADARGNITGTRKVRPTVILPAGARSQQTDPEEITVTLVAGAARSK